MDITSCIKEFIFKDIVPYMLIFFVFIVFIVYSAILIK